MMKLVLSGLPLIAIGVAIAMKLQGKPISWLLIASPGIGLFLCLFLAVGVAGVPGDTSKVSSLYMNGLIAAMVVGFGGMLFMMGSTVLLIIKIIRLL